jgi:hypothetical protein
MQQVGLSDGGIIFADADDVLVYRDRNWRDGRDDQTQYWTLSDNVCTTETTVWDARLITADDGLSTAVRLVNVAGLEALQELDANPYSVAHVLTHPDADQWTTQAEGDDLAQWQLDRRSVVLVDVEELTLYVHDDRQDLFPLAVDTRIGDRMFFRHAYRTPTTLEQFTVGIVVSMIRHSINANEWVMTLGAWTFPATLRPYVYDAPSSLYDADGEYS